LLNLSPITKAIRGLTADSRAIQPGFLFAAIPGTKMDGRDFIPNAIAQGASHILAPTGTAIPDGATLIESDNPRADFARLAAAFYDLRPQTIVGVTGTNGKTSSVNILRQLWETLGHKSAAIGTLGVIGTDFYQAGSLTTPDPVKMHETFAALRKAGINRAAIEASSHGIEQERLAGTHFAAAIFTNLTRDHLDYHGTMENYFTAKARLFTELLPSGAPAIINADDPYGQELIAMCRPRLRVISYGLMGDVKLLGYQAHADGFDVTIAYDGVQHRFHLPLLGKFQIWNVLGALACLIALGEKVPDILSAIARLQSVRGRLEMVARSTNGAPVFVDYAHTPDALQGVLEAVREHATGKLKVIFGCGGDRDKGKRPQMGAIAVRLADRVIVTDDNPRTEDAATIRAEVLAGCDGKATEIGDRRTAIQTAVHALAAGDILVVAGKGHEQGQIVGSTVIPFDDAEVVREAIAKE
jgi:UDP-N-acetylmuramoyl-L-alanyl-D-glutamate--2,6-diaminopimelate ligase